MLVLLQGLIPKIPDEEEGKEDKDEIEDDENNASEEGEGGADNNYLKPDNYL